MTTTNPSYGPTIQHPQYTLVQNAQVCLAYICDVLLLSLISMQTLGGRDHELSSNEHLLPDIDSASPYPAVNHADARPPTRYTSTMGNEDPLAPHVAIVRVHFIRLHAPFGDGGCGKGPWTISGERKATST